ncbi:hypothetical protein WSM22_16050 [Cytophagales bacterium WSM2-2]|nr:hypothetical protein WSM22_16050 [Cytophagales bacterium WSM2-2]
MIKAFAILVACLMCLVALPVFFGLAGGLFGLIIGIIGGVVGLICGIVGGIVGVIAGIFKGIIHALFGWHSDFGYHHSHWHFNGYIFAALIVLIFALATRKNK